MKYLTSYLYEIVKSLDQCLNVIFSPLLNLIFWTDKFGGSDQTISGVIGRLARDNHKVAMWMNKQLSTIFDQNNHGIAASDPTESSPWERLND